jgi:hypothetical protein
MHGACGAWARKSSRGDRVRLRRLSWSAECLKAAVRSIAVAGAELSELHDSCPVLLINPGELEPELALRYGGGRVAAGDEHSQCRTSVGGQFLHRVLQCPKLFEGSAGQQSHVRLRASSSEAPKGFELGGCLVKLLDDFAVTTPRKPEFVRFSWRHSLEIPSYGFVFRLDALVVAFKPIEPIPEVGAEPFGPLFFRRTHRPHPVCVFSSERVRR